MGKRWTFTSESVTEGHPDKICDQIADAILDELIKEEPSARVACETCVSTGQVFVFGQITAREAYCDIPKVARDVIRDIGYTHNQLGFDADACSVITAIGEQSPDIASGVDRSYELRTGSVVDEGQEDLGAGDQGMVFGYANRDTDVLMPMPIQLAHRLSRALTQARKEKYSDLLRPDGKTQVTVAYEDHTPVHLDTIVLSTQHSPEVDMATLKDLIVEEVLKPSLPPELFDEKTKLLINPSGRFVVGGPQGDSGLTGRKLIVDTYGGFAHHGGGALSGKDCTKVDRSGAYAARFAAKNIVAAGLADACEVTLAYAIGVAEPVDININTFGTGRASDTEIEKALRSVMSFTPKAIINRFDLRHFTYRPVANYGHFGREDLDLPWEHLDLVPGLQEADIARKL